ncbi:hypothetical protein [Bacillus atrophaeus]|uniref:hypothetical protein n=1 Tax=Bacillus atrophaeus TaxID=1452 RepID=UPI002DBE1967|nr:hypothetical protein [Bacillus atrophaeus]MEC2309461.1 hypothetical protein [Bacillus atrophaeus]
MIVYQLAVSVCITLFAVSYSPNKPTVSSVPITGSENPTLDPPTCGLSYIVSTALDYGVDNKMIKTNVAKKAILPKEPKRKRIDVWDLEQANQFLETSKEDEQNRYHLAYAIAVICLNASGRNTRAYLERC